MLADRRITVKDWRGKRDVTLALATADIAAAVRGAEEKIGLDPVVLDVRGLLDCFDALVIVGGRNDRQVRAIAEVATAVTKGDLTRSIQVEARGEVAELKDNINTMIDNLRLTTDRNTEQDWLKTNLARFTNMLQGQRDLGIVGRMLLSELTPLVNASRSEPFVL